MRRVLALVAFVLVALGLELSTQTLSLTISRLVAGISGAELDVPSWRFVTGLVFIAFGLVLLGLIVWAGRARRAVGSQGSVCPNCGSHTRRVRRKRWQRLLAVLVGQGIARRKCETCGWIGLAMRD